MGVIAWIAAGAAFGIKAFVALFVFALCCFAVLGLIAAVGKMAGGNGDE